MIFQNFTQPIIKLKENLQISPNNPWINYLLNRHYSRPNRGMEIKTPIELTFKSSTKKMKKKKKGSFIQELTKKRLIEKNQILDSNAIVTLQEK